jgi:hypothetical protein
MLEIHSPFNSVLHNLYSTCYFSFAFHPTLFLLLASAFPPSPHSLTHSRPFPSLSLLHSLPLPLTPPENEGVKVRLQEVSHTELKSWLGKSAVERMEKQWGDLETFSGIGARHR